MLHHFWNVPIISASHDEAGAQNDAGTAAREGAATGEHGTRVAKVLQKYPSVSSIDEIKAFMRAVKPKEYFSEV